jgi:hypothetical protein
MPIELARQAVTGAHGARATNDVCRRLAEDRFVVDGRELALPMRIADLGVLAQVFAVPARAARELLAESGVSLVEIWPGAGALILMAVEYRDNPLGAYREAAILLPAYAPGERALPVFGGLDILRKRASHFVYAMPVDQEFTTHAGRFLWGFPKFLAQLAIELGTDTARARFAHDDQLVFGMQVPSSERGVLAQRLENLTERDGVVRKIAASVEGRGFAFRLGGQPPEIGETHPLALTLRALGLPRRPLCSLSLRHASAEFGVAQTCPLSARAPSQT